MTEDKKENNNSKEYKEIFDLISFIHSLVTRNEYIARSEYKTELLKYQETVNFFKVLIKSDLLNDYCKKNDLSADPVIKTISFYDEIDQIISKHNEKFIRTSLVVEKDYLDNILKEVDPEVRLDLNQREVVLTDEDYCLVIAGAGAGKTTTVAAKAKYLVDKKRIQPNEILIVSFTNKAVDELRQKINKDLKLDCIISTFHSIGNAILKTQSSFNPTIVTEGNLYYLLLDYFKRSVFSNESLTKKLLLFFSTYFDVPSDTDDIGKFLNELSKANYTTLKSDLNEFKQQIIDSRSKKKVTIQNEIVRSYQEVQIANYLYLNNIDYRYEPLYRYNIKLANKPYTPDFIIKQGNNVAYLEHFGITQNGENSIYNNEELEKYKKSVNDKILLHREHGTKLIYTFSQYNDGRSLIQHLDEELRKNGFVPKKKNEGEVLNKIIETEESKYISKLLALICRFINLFKINGYSAEQFDIFKNSTQNVRNQLFLDIAKECYLEYERYLKETNSIDFQDMINQSAVALEEMANKKEKLHFKYVIVDEYQDISKQRFDLVGALHKVCDAKVVAVGDDWQSIYAFSGSDISLFLEFEKKMGYAKMLKIENTYRNSQEVIDIAGNFILKNDQQIKKALKSPKHIKEPFIIYTYDSSQKDERGNNKSGANYNMARATANCLDDIVEYNKKENKKNNKVLILGRYNFDANSLEKSGLFEVRTKSGKMIYLEHPELEITFMTAHASKGLGFDNVVIINCQNAKFGFPSKIQNDPVLKHVLIEDKSYDYAEERRLFYVAMTRTKNRVYCVAPAKNPSEFLLEIYKDYGGIIKHGEWEEETVNNSFKNKCPICGYPMQYKYKPAFGLRLNICTNDPEVCGFMSNDLKAGKMQIMKCDQCQDGYLIIKKSSKNDYFLGCTNYKEDGTGCNNSISRNKYFEMTSLTPDEPVRAVKRDFEKIKKERDMTITANDDERYETRSFDMDNPKDIAVIAKIIILCVNHTSQKIYFGIKKTVSILTGKEPQTKAKINFKSIPEFGKLAKCKKKDIEILIHAMISQRYLLQTKELYPVLHPTNEGAAFYRQATEKEINKLFDAYKKNLEKFESYKEEENSKNTEPNQASIEEISPEEKDESLLERFFAYLSNRKK